MKKLLFYSPLLLVFSLLSSCETDSSGDSFGSPSEGGGSSSNGNGNQNQQPGVITAGEWNDLEHWDFWEDILTKEEYQPMPGHWSIFNNHRIAVRLMSADQSPVVNALVELKRAGSTIFSARSDNQGRAELWADIQQKNDSIDLSQLSIAINQGAQTLNAPKAYRDGTNDIVLPAAPVDNKIEIAFVVDATGSMGDELEYLKTELLDVISRIQNANASARVLTASVFYRDQGDEYLTRLSPFSADPKTTINFIQEQSASGGGDYPEAVHTALNQAVNQLQWSVDARSRILFLVLDAPPHHNNVVINDLQGSLLKSAEKGIKIIPISASGVDKQTEFLMRFLAISTNGTYVFITDDSGIGNSHLPPTVGQYQVEFLNDLMVRLINQSAE